jgi:hypothetical protein
MTLSTRPLRLACLVGATCLVAGQAAAQQTPPDSMRSTPPSRARISHAAAVGRMVTGVSIVTGAALAYGAAHGSGDGDGLAIAGGTVGWFGILVGPAIGWGMRGDYVRGASGVALRGAGVVLIGHAVSRSAVRIFEDDAGVDTGAEIGLGMLAILTSFTWDLITVGHVPRGDRAANVGIEPMLVTRDGERTCGLVARARF